MYIINFTHPLIEANIQEIIRLTGAEIDKVVEVSAQFDVRQPLSAQVEEMVKAVGLSADEWQTLPILLNLPSLNYSTAVLLTMLHGLTGHHPAIIRMRPQAGSIIPLYEVAEIINLQEFRDKCRQLRNGTD